VYWLSYGCLKSTQTFGHFCGCILKITNRPIFLHLATLFSLYFTTLLRSLLAHSLPILTIMRPLSADIRDRILAHIDHGLSDRKVAAVVGVSRSSVQKIRKQHRSNVCAANRGRPASLSVQNKRHLVRLVTSGKLDTAVSANHQLQADLGVFVSDDTVRRMLMEAGLAASAKVAKPMLSRKNVAARLAFAKRHQHWTVEDWERVIWSDETKINRFSSDGRSWCWVRDVENQERRTIKQTVKHGGGSLMIWGCMTVHGPGFMCKLEGTMVKETYKSILQDELARTIDHYGMDPQRVIFQHDNDPKHTARIVHEWLNEQLFDVLIWPDQSPDLNPIEHLWAWMKIRLNQYERAPTGMVDLWDRVQDVWNGFGADECRRLIHTMPQRVEAVLQAKGWWTRF
jgi:transposase